MLVVPVVLGVRYRPLRGNLCHNCGACLHVCQYAPPHEFAVNVPRAMARVRRQTYAEYSWPAALGTLYRRNGLVLSLATALGLALFLVLALALRGTLSGAGLNASFYAVFTHNTMALMFGVVFQKPMDRGFIALLMLISATGLLLLGLRDTAAMAVLLAIHLGP